MPLWKTVLDRASLGAAGWTQLGILFLSLALSWLFAHEVLTVLFQPDIYPFGAEGPFADYWYYKSWERYVLVSLVNAAMFLTIAALAACLRVGKSAIGILVGSIFFGFVLIQTKQPVAYLASWLYGLVT